MSDRDLDSDPCCEPPFQTLCTGNTNNNYWFEEGKCMLDDLYPLRKDQLVYIIERTPQARMDLPKITSCPELLQLLELVPLLSITTEDNELPDQLNRGDNPYPFYELYRGNCNNR
jgi:hypothetical protein